MVSLVDVLQELLELPGAVYSCVADRATGRVLAEWGRRGAEVVAPPFVVRCGSGVADAFAGVPGDEMDDLMITSKRSYHVVRQLAAGSAHPLLVYLCLDRGRSNLAAARRELALPQLHDRIAAAAGAAASPPVPESQRPEPQLSELHGPEPQRPELQRSDLRERSPGARTPTIPAAAPPRPAAGERTPPRVPLPRRPVGAALPPAPDVPDPEPLPEGEVPAVLQQTWATDPGTMRRLVIGLRRLVG